MNLLDKPLQIGSWNLPNRVVFQPMEGCDAMTGGAATAAGAPGELTWRRYLRFAESGTAMIWFEAVSVCEEGRANPRQHFLTAETMNGFKILLEEMRDRALAETGQVPKIIAQLTHSGRFAKPKGTPEPLVAYRNPVWERDREDQPYHIVTDDYCKQMVSDYAKAAELAAQAGFDGVDIKCCHGYLLNEFLSAYERPGCYGGSFENRTRLFFECLEAARQVLPASVLLTTRLNACDGFPYPHGYGVSPQREFDLSECKEILRILQVRFGVELVNMTLGNPYLIPHINRPAKGLIEPGEVGMARIRSLMKDLQATFPELALVASGLSYPGVDAVTYAEVLLEEGAATMAGFGRLTFSYPRFYWDFLETGRLDKKKVCLACGKCTLLMRAGTVAGCPVRDAETYMPYYKKYVLS